MGAPSDFNAELQRFAADLRALMSRAGIPSYREVARRAHFSHTTIAEAAGGKALPTLEVTRGFVSACSEHLEEWEERWQRIDRLRQTVEAVDAVPSLPSAAASPWPPIPVVDGADPDEAGCSPDAITAHARRIALSGERRIVGVVELRYCPPTHAAWGRFKGYPLLDNIASSRQDIEIIIDVVRQNDGRRAPFTQRYSFDYHWGDLLVTDGGPFYACVSINFGTDRVAYAETDKMELA
jgi:hypothetical protein